MRNADDRSPEEAESIARQMRMLQGRRVDTEMRTHNAVRRVTLTVLTMLLAAFALWQLIR